MLKPTAFQEHRSMETPSVWNHLETANGHFVYGLRLDAVALEYHFVATDLSGRFWVETASRDEIVSRLDDLGIVDMGDGEKLSNFLKLLQEEVDSGTGLKAETGRDADVNMLSVEETLKFNLECKRLTWRFSAILAREDSMQLDRILKLQILDTLGLEKSANEELERQLRGKDRVIQTLLENFLELNNSYTSSVEENVIGTDNDEFARRVASNKQLERLFPSGTEARKSLFKFDQGDIYKHITTGSDIWHTVDKCLENKRIWRLSKTHIPEGAVGTSQTLPRPKKIVSNDDFMTLDELRAAESSHRSQSPKRRRVDDSDGYSTSRQVDKPKVSEPSPVRTRVFGVVGGGGGTAPATPSRKRKLKAGNSSPIKAPRLI